jgi:hypothetical protein
MACALSEVRDGRDEFDTCLPKLATPNADPPHAEGMKRRRLKIAYCLRGNHDAMV